MKRISDGLYTWKEKGDKDNKTLRMWHDCDSYKDRDTARVELEREGKKFTCPYCGFEYVI